jgi:mevalonate pyrophosphate decarboxylase
LEGHLSTPSAAAFRSLAIHISVRDERAQAAKTSEEIQQIARNPFGSSGRSIRGSKRSSKFDQKDGGNTEANRSGFGADGEEVPPED